MYLNKFVEKKTGRVFLTYQETRSVVDPENPKGPKKKKNFTVEKLGYLDELEKTYDDPIAFFKQQAKEAGEKKKAEAKKKDGSNLVTISMQKDAIMPKDAKSGEYHASAWIGYYPIQWVLTQLGVFKTVEHWTKKNTKIEYALAEYLNYLVARRIIDPTSKLQDFKHTKRFLEEPNIALENIYRGLDVLYKMKTELLQTVHENMVSRFHRNSELMFYDVTNVHFEVEDEDSFRKKGVAKSNKPLPIVQIGLFMDKDGVPVWFDTYEGNTNDCITFLPSYRKLQQNLGVKHAIYVADKAMHTGDNVANLIANQCGYVISESIRKTKETTRNIAFDVNGYTAFDEHGNRYEALPLTKEGKPDFDIISFMYKKVEFSDDITFTNCDNEKQKLKNFPRTKLFYWSSKYAKRAQLERQEMVEKAMNASGTRSKSVIDNNHGKNALLKTNITDKSTGKAVKEYDAKVQFDVKKLEEMEACDGYYIIETNLVGRNEYGGTLPTSTDSFWDSKTMRLVVNQDLTSESIIDIYRGLWQIEQCFRVTKTELNMRPVYLRKKERIDAHVTICFLALIVLRLLRKLTGECYSIEQIVRSLSEASVCKADTYHFINLFYSDFLSDLRDVTGLDYSQNVFMKSEFTKMRKIAETRKHVGKC